MSPFQSVDPLAQADGDVDQLQQQIPDICSTKDLAGVLGVSVWQVGHLQRQGRLAHLELKPSIGTARFSGAKIRAWLRGEDLTAARRFFGSARKGR